MSSTLPVVFCGYIFLLFPQISLSSSTMTADELNQVEKTDLSSDAQQLRLKKVAVILAEYEIEAQRLTKQLGRIDRSHIDQHAVRLMRLSESVIDWARIRLSQCDEYLYQTLALKDRVKDIKHAVMERDYHHDGALPKAPAECYHIKDLLVHPASVLILTRDDPALQAHTLASIHAEISEVLGHTEAVRHLVIY